ncbi:ABC transporter permease DevC [Pleurocapsa sp. PCC 7319]|uniref:ABC transporter permease DevC n=1 Tax=Pleurocapsa sp. PCC 7319 TaxID=118161 RepID=UPI000346901A|nr:ABC transporter permease DevC [Pleurocapsa sp. PCC 7319]
MKTPLSWLQLSHEKARLLIALAGIGFADMLMFIQLGFQAALFDSSVTFHKALQGDIFLMSPQSDALGFTEPFSERRLYQSAAVDQVESVVPIYLNYGSWKNPIERNTRTILTIGFNPAQNPVNFPGIKENIDQIKLPDVVLFDKQSRAEFGAIAELLQQNGTVKAEVSSRKVTVRGLFSMGASFAADGNIITSDTNFLRLFDDRQKGLIDVGIINLKPGTDIELAKANLKAKLPQDVEIFDREEFIQEEISYWQNATAIGFIFTLGTAIGFVVGTVIVYQILYTDVANHLSEYATLKAMGYRDSYFVILVFQEAVILAVLGFLPGYAIATGLYSLAAGATALPLAMTVNRATTVLILTVIMCCASGSVAVRKLSAADPADIF